MQIKNIIIHNYRTIKDEIIELTDYSLLVGKNNAGKSNIISAIRTFYEHNKFKYVREADFPKFSTDDDESWIEIHYLTTDNEQSVLKEEYQSTDKVLKVRRYFQGDKVKSGQSNIYAYENGILSDNLFYGAKNISQDKLGEIIYIPDIMKSDEVVKLTGPSVFREMINPIMRSIVQNSDEYNALKNAFALFNAEFKNIKSDNNSSLNDYIADINDALKSWNISFDFNVIPIQSDDIVKNQLNLFLKDHNLGDEEMSLSSFGQGTQRHLIYTLFNLSSKYQKKKKIETKTFSTDFTLILFEEPEAFLHPSQQEILNLTLKKIGEQEDRQVLITTHSPLFVSRSIEDMKGIIRLQKRIIHTDIKQINQQHIDIIAQDIVTFYANSGLSPSDIPTDDTTREMLKYSLWLNSDRTNIFFANHVIICEGASEKVFIEYLARNLPDWKFLYDNQVYILEGGGKFNINRYMELLGSFGIEYSILLDVDDNVKDTKMKTVHNQMNTLIKNKANNPFCNNRIYFFDDDFEDFLGIDQPTNSHDKPINVLVKYENGDIDPAKIEELKNIIESFII